MEFVLASFNRDKLRELAALLDLPGLTLCPLGDVPGATAAPARTFSPMRLSAKSKTWRR